MVYKLGQRVGPKSQGLKPLGLAAAATLIISMVATVYANSSSAGSQASPRWSGRQAVLGTTIKRLPSQAKSSGANTAAATTQTSSASLQTASCDVFPSKTPGLSTAMSPELRKLAQYQQVCSGALTDRDSFFVPTPTTVAAAGSDASDAAARLKEYALFGIKPLVFMEPATDSGANIDLSLYQSGAYDSALDAYFADLKADGITDAMMGMWVAIPEGNIPVWTSVNPTTYVADVTKVIGFQKKYFPASLATIMLDSESYPSASTWSNGAYVSLLPYVQTIPKGLVDSFGLQGFPWAPPANQAGDTLYNPKVYLRTDLAAQAAHALGVSSIWFNTGTFHQMYAQTAAETVTLTPLQRQTMLNGVVSEAVSLKQQGFTVDVHLFAQDKADTSEGTDWSYWQTLPGADANTVVFTTFVHNLNASGVPLWLFDTYDQ